MKEEESEQKPEAENAAEVALPTGDEVTAYWNEYTDSLKTESPRMYTTLKSALPHITGEGVIRVHLKNNAQKEDFDQYIKWGLLQYLKRESRYPHLEIESLVEKETENDKNKLYTSIDKYKFLERKNEHLKELRKRFNLDIE